MKKTDNLNSFLSLGYFLDYKNPNISFDLSGIPELKQQMSQFSEEELLEECKKRWYKTFENLYQKGDHLVPLSGGLDSRAILATLLEFVEADKISTYTFGTPGTYDYEIGKLVAKKAGTNHRQYSFNEYVFTTDKEIEVSKRIDHQTFLFHHPPIEELDRLYKNHFVWSGFILDFVAGSYLPKKNQEDIENAKTITYIKDKYVKSSDLTSPEFKGTPQYDIPLRLLSNKSMSYEEQITINNRILKNSYPHILYKGFNYKLPVLFKDFFEFFFALQDNHRRNETFYINYLINEYPSLFSIPVKSNYGLCLNASDLQIFIKKIQNRLYSYSKKILPALIHPHTNYLDFNEGIRNRKDLNKVILENIEDLKSRKIVDWIDISLIYKNHMNRKGNYADALIVLASLEIHLKAGKIL